MLASQIAHLHLGGVLERRNAEVICDTHADCGLTPGSRCKDERSSRS